MNQKTPSAKGNPLLRALRSTRGAIDLASIMVGVLVIGVVGGAVSATVFGVIPWSQDNAARASLASVATAQSASMVRDGGYADSRDLEAQGWLKSSESLATAAGTTVGENCWVAVAKSATGKVFYSTDASADTRPLFRSTTAGCIDAAALAALVDSVGGYDGIALVNLQATIFTDGRIGQAYSGQINFESEKPATFKVTAGNWPAGLTLAEDTGKISGTPTANAISRFTVTAENEAGKSHREYSITVGLAAPVVVTASLPDAVKNEPYTAAIEYTGSETILSYGLGDLPAGIGFDDKTGTFSGTPTVVGTFPFTVYALNTGGVSSQALSITSSMVAPTITTASLPGGVKGTAYSAAVATTGNEVVYSISDGALPVGLTIDENTGIISGAPTTVATSSFTVKAQNDGGSATRELTIEVELVAPAITRGTLPGATKGVAYSQTLTWTGENVFFAKSLGDMPDGITIDGTTGVISGTPTAAGTFNFTISAVNTGGTTAQALSIVVTVTPPVITTNTIPNAQVGVGYSLPITATGEGVVLSPSVGSPGPGLSFNGTAVVGTPTTAGTYNFSINASNGGGSVTKAFTITVLPAAPTLRAGGTIATVNRNSPFSVSIAGTGTGVTYSAIAGSWPGGVNLSTAGVISGNPTVTNTAGYTFTIRAQNAGGYADATYTVVVNEVAPTLAPAQQFASGTRGTAYPYSMSVAGNSAPGTGYRIFAGDGAVPPGMFLNATTGAITGNPTASGTFEFSVTATNSGGTARAYYYVYIARTYVTNVASSDFSVSNNGFTGGTYLAATPKVYFTGVGQRATKVISNSYPGGATIWVTANIFSRNATSYSVGSQIGYTLAGTERYVDLFTPGVSTFANTVYYGTAEIPAGATNIRYLGAATSGGNFNHASILIDASW